MINIEEEKVPYKKFKDGDVSKASKKSKHKHNYFGQVIFEYQHKYNNASVHHYAMSYCTICGKIGKGLDGYMSKDADGYYHFWTLEDYLKKYPNADFIQLEKGKTFFDIENINEVK